MSVPMPCMTMNRRRYNVPPGKFHLANLAAPVSNVFIHPVTFVGVPGANAPLSTMKPVRCAEVVMQFA